MANQNKDYVFKSHIGLSQSDDIIYFPKEGEWLANCIEPASSDEKRGEPLSYHGIIDGQRAYHITKKYVYLTIYFTRGDLVLDEPESTTLNITFDNLHGYTTTISIVENFQFALEARSENENFLSQGGNVRYFTQEYGHTYGVLHYRIPSSFFRGLGKLHQIDCELRATNNSNSIRNQILTLDDCSVYEHVYWKGGTVVLEDQYTAGSGFFSQSSINGNVTLSSTEAAIGNRKNLKYFYNKISASFNIEQIGYMGSILYPDAVCFFNSNGERISVKNYSTSSFSRDSEKKLQLTNLEINNLNETQITHIGFLFKNPRWGTLTEGVQESSYWVKIPITNTSGFYHYSCFKNQAFDFHVDSENDRCRNIFVSATQDTVTLKSQLKGRCEIDSWAPYTLLKRDGEYENLAYVQLISDRATIANAKWNGNNGFEVEVNRTATFKRQNNTLTKETGEDLLSLGEYGLSVSVINNFTGGEEEIFVKSITSSSPFRIDEKEDYVYLGGPQFKIKHNTSEVKGNILLPEEKIEFLNKNTAPFYKFSLASFMLITQRTFSNFGFNYYCGTTSFDETPTWTTYGASDYSYASLSNGQEKYTNGSVKNTKFIQLQPTAAGIDAHIFAYNFQLGRINTMTIQSVSGSSGNVLTYYLLDNGGDRKQGKNGNEFVNNRFSANKYFSLSREDVLNYDNGKTTETMAREGIRLEFYEANTGAEVPAATLFVHMGGPELLSVKQIQGAENHYLFPPTTVAKLFKEYTYVELPFGELLQNLSGSSYYMKGTYLYYYDNNFNNPRELFTFTTDNFTFLGAGNVGIPVLGMRKRGIIVNPKDATDAPEDLEWGEAVKVNVIPQETEHGLVCKPLSIVLYKQNGEEYKEDGKPISCDIEYRPEENGEPKGFYINGISLQKVKETIENNNEELEKKVEAIEDKVGDESKGLVYKTNLLETKITNLYIPDIEVIEGTNGNHTVSETNNNVHITIPIAGYDTSCYYIPTVFPEFDDSSEQGDINKFHFFLVDTYESSGNYVLKIYAGVHSTYGLTNNINTPSVTFKIRYHILKIRKPTGAASTQTFNAPAPQPMVIPLEEDTYSLRPPETTPEVEPETIPEAESDATLENELVIEDENVEEI